MVGVSVAAALPSSFVVTTKGHFTCLRNPTIFQYAKLLTATGKS